ncbi:hypothetical protein GCM10022290_16070 [Sagittula marina]
MIADAVNPTGEANGFAHVGLGQVNTGMAAIGVHDFSPLKREWLGHARIHRAVGVKSSEQPEFTANDARSEVEQRFGGVGHPRLQARFSGEIAIKGADRRSFVVSLT